MTTSILAEVLLAVFAALAALGAYLVIAHFRSRRAGLVAALLTLAFFAALAVALAWLAESYAGP